MHSMAGAVVLDLARGDGRNDNLKALAAEGYELVGSGYVVAVTANLRLASRVPTPPPAPPAGLAPAPTLEPQAGTVLSTPEPVAP